MGSSSISTRRIQNIVDQLCLEKHRNPTRATYHHIWKLFNQFFIQLDAKPCSWEDHLVLFTGFLVDSNLKSSTVKSYISAICSVLQELGEHLSENNYLLKSLTRACRLCNDTIIRRLPVSKDVLNMILKQVGILFGKQPYLQKLYAALFSSAFYGLLRIGPHVILAQNVHGGINKNKILFILVSSKTHTKGDKPQLVKITSKPLDNMIKPKSFTKKWTCPFKLLKDYIASRPHAINASEQFFVFTDRTPLKMAQVRRIFNQTVEMAGLHKHAYTFHGLHTGRASCLLKLGLSVETIKKIGRWRSNSVFTYLRD